MKVVLAGSSFIALGAFEEIIKHHEVLAIITQPDRKKGRGMKVQETDVALLAKKYNIKTFKPEKVGSIYKELKALDFDILVTFAFGQYVPTKILSLGKYKPVNIHGSLLPKYRGAAPIHWAILNGDKEIGITLIEMIQEMDAGNMFFKASQVIDDKTTTGEGFNILASLAKNNINSWLKKIETKNFKLTKQSNDFTLAPKIEKSFSQLTNDLTIEKAIRKIRGLNPFPGAFIFIDNKRLKVFEVSEEEIKHAIKIEFSRGFLYAIDYQWENKKRQQIK